MKNVIIALLFAVALGIVGQGDYEDAAKEHAHYCAMVDTWQRFQGTRGHPNYEDRDCSDQLKAFVKKENAEALSEDE